MQDKLNGLEKRYGVDWREFKIGDLFEVGTGSLLDLKNLPAGNIPRVSVKTDENGIIGYFDTENIEGARHFENFISVNFFGKSFYHKKKSSLEMKVHTLKIPNHDFTKSEGMYFSALLDKQLQGFSYGNQLSSSKLKNENYKIILPTTNNEIAFDYINDFVETLEAERLATLEAERLATLEAYLKVTGLNNVVLSAEERSSLDKLRSGGSVSWKVFNLEQLFGRATRGRRLKSADRVVGNLPFVTAGEADMGISAFIGNDVQVFSENTVTIDMFGSAKYRNYKYGADDHVAVVHTEKLDKFSALFTTSTIHKSAHAGQFDYSRNFYATDADELMISLPVRTDGKIDYDFMSNLMSAMQKIVIKGVVEWADKRIELTRGAINK
ncbi:restriction endonuclease subunit S [Lactococcus nasutitermitis]|uniref:Restriction endonuclease subunit S n=1 Tax=Lactococcus nasutitermitis TaxID=1652957 RepID=A0ABV9JD64_9LACT|nr:restriction endonuclease subunit S [Lactococcus nasutitermitis]